jgi:hypothetical protein
VNAQAIRRAVIPRVPLRVSDLYLASALLPGAWRLVERASHR